MEKHVGMDELMDRLKQAIDFAIDSNYEIYDRAIKINKRLEQAEKVCVFGTGGFFEGYHKYLKRIDFLCDNDEYKNGTKICGFPCYPPEKLKETKDTAVVIMVGNYKGIQRQLDEMGIENYPFTELFMNVYTEYHGAGWFKGQNDRIFMAYEMFEDTLSKECFAESICQRIAPHLSRKTFHELESSHGYFNEDLYKLSDHEVYVDAGAFDGDTVESFIQSVNGEYNKIYAFELDKNNYSKMQQRLHKYLDQRMELFNYGCSDAEGIMKYISNETGSNINHNGNEEAILVRLDDYVEDMVTLLKMDIEGAEIAALEGAKTIICKYRPRLMISAYHRLEDLWDVPLKIKELDDSYKLYLRHHSPLVWDTDCYAL